MDLVAVFVLVVSLMAEVSGIYVTDNPRYLTKDMIPTSTVCPTNCLCDNLTKQATCDIYNTFLLDNISDDWTVTKLSVFGKMSFVPLIFSPRFENVTEFTLTGTSVDTIWEFCFQHLIHVEYLDLSRNKINKIQENSLQPMADLLHLNLSRNDIQFLSSKTFQNLNSLASLDLSYNRLRYIHTETFSNTRKLSFLDLSHNQIKYLKNGVFDSLTDLRTLLLNDNNLIRLSTTVIEPITNLQEISLAHNNWECSCTLENLINYMQKNRRLFLDKNNVKCKQPSDWEGKALHNVSHLDLPCFAPQIFQATQDQSFPIRNTIYITCTTYLYPHGFKYWVTPWGQELSHNRGNVDWRARNLTVKQRREYHGLVGHTEPNSVLYVDDNDTLHIENFRAWFRGTYTCVAFNEGGEANTTINVHAYTVIPSVFKESWKYASFGVAFMLLVASIVTIVKMCRRCVRSCCARKVKDVKESQSIETEDIDDSKSSTLDSCHSYQDNFDNDSMPKSPLSSPWFRTPRASPKKCTTPTAEPSEGWLPSNIIETLDEVKIRLDRKMERVRKNVHSIRVSGSQYITTIKDTGSQAANRVRAGMVLGVEQVKSGVQSIKEFCGTGDMGTQTISVISVSTDVDTAEKTRVIKSVTYV